MSFSNDFFEEIDRIFKEEMRRIRKMITEMSRIKPEFISELEKRGEPMVFGFTYRWHSGMKRPEVKFFGNVKPVEPYGIRISEESTPVYDMLDKEDHYEIIVELAGARKDDIDLQIKDNQLDIRAKTPYKKYSLQLRLPSDAILDEIRAKLNNGILVITLPKRKEKVEGRRINIEEED